MKLTCHKVHKSTSEVNMIGKTKSIVGVHMMDEDNSSNLANNTKDDKLNWKNDMNK